MAAKCLKLLDKRIISKDSNLIRQLLSLDRYLPYHLKVVFGLFDGCYADITSTTYSVSNIIIHPEFQYPTRLNDLALLRLNSAVPFQQRISPICLPTPGMYRRGISASLLDCLSFCRILAHNQTILTEARPLYFRCQL